jgi:endoribonuclease Dicer
MSVDNSTRCFIPELCARSTIPASIFRTVHLLPAVMHRIDELLLVKELNSCLFGRLISDDLLLQAITAPSCGTHYDYERLEWLGDSFLKYLASCYFFGTNPGYNEGQLHTARREFISNKTFFLASNRVQLPQYIQSKPFNLKLWSPALSSHDAAQSSIPSIANVESTQAIEPSSMKRSKSRRRWEDQNVQLLGDKVLANVLEAIVAAAFLSNGREAGLTTSKALDLPLPNIYQWSDMNMELVCPLLQHIPPASVEAIESLTNFKFNHPGWLSQAMTHISMHNDKTASYERLEYLGDAILDFVVVCYLYDKYPNVAPGGLSMLKSAMVCNSALAAISVHYGFHEHILFRDHRAANSVKSYATQLGLHKERELQMAKREDRRPGQYWVGIEPPKVKDCP